MRARTESTPDTFKSLRIRAGDSRFCESPASTERRGKKTWITPSKISVLYW